MRSQLSLLKLYSKINNEAKEESKQPKMHKSKSQYKDEESKIDKYPMNKKYSNFQSKGQVLHKF